MDVDAARTGSQKQIVEPHTATRSSLISLLPTAIARVPAAIPSSTVDLPDPFSPTKNVTGVSNSSASREATTGTVQGNPPSSDGRRRRADKYTRAIVTYCWFVGSLVRWFVGSLVRGVREVRWFVGFVAPRGFRKRAPEVGSADGAYCELLEAPYAVRLDVTLTQSFTGRLFPSKRDERLDLRGPMDQAMTAG